MSIRLSLGRAASVCAAGAALAGAVASPGCNNADLQTYCEERESCRGGNEQDTEACVVAAETEEYIVADIGCSDEYVAYFDCLLEKGSCVTIGQGQSCNGDEECFGGRCNGNVCETKDFQTEGDDCEVEQRAYSRCFDLD